MEDEMKGKEKKGALVRHEKRRREAELVPESEGRQLKV